MRTATLAGRSTEIWNKLGPGLVYAGAAVGVSHLVQSTRAGAQFGFALVWAVVLANVIKYPFFEFSTRHVSATGHSILYGYRLLGKWALYIFNALTIVSMFTIQAAVTVVTAGLAEEFTGFGWGTNFWCAVLLVLCLTILVWGKYAVLDNLVKFIVLLLSITTLIAVGVAFRAGHVATGVSFDFSSSANLFFLAALMGWMPAPMDVAVWSSVWGEEKNIVVGRRRKLRESSTDFQVGYWGTTLLAVAFLSLGALVMYGKNKSFSPSAVQFASQLVGMFTDMLGAWSYPLIATAALSTMLSTTITCLDAFPRVLIRSFGLLRVDITEDQSELRLSANNARNVETKQYFFWALIVSIGSLLLLTLFVENMKMMVDFATTLAFVTAPVIAYLNYRVMHLDNIKKQFLPPTWLRLYAVVGLMLLSAFSVGYLWIRYISEP